MGLWDRLVFEIPMNKRCTVVDSGKASAVTIQRCQVGSKTTRGSNSVSAVKLKNVASVTLFTRAGGEAFEKTSK